MTLLFSHGLINANMFLGNWHEVQLVRMIHVVCIIHVT